MTKKKPTDETDAPKASSDGVPEWLRDAMTANPQPASRRGRKVGSRSTLTRAHNAAENLEVVDNALRDKALDSLCNTMAMGGIVTKRDLDAQIRAIAARANVTAKTLRSDLAKQIENRHPWARGRGMVDVQTIAAIMKWENAADAREERARVESEWLAEVRRISGN